MLVDTLFSRAANSKVVLQRFWGLLLVVLVLAVSSSAVAVWMTATPFLEQERAGVINSQANRDVHSLEAKLERFRVLLDFLSHAPPVVDTVMGYVDSADVVQEFVERLKLPSEVSWIKIFDAFGEELADFRFDTQSQNLLGGTPLTDLVQRTNEKAAGFERSVVFAHDDTGAHIAIASPVLFQEFTEGVVVVGMRIDTNALFPANEIAKDTFIAKSSSIRAGITAVPEGAKVVPLSATDLSVVLLPDTKVVEAAGSELLTTTVGALSLVLVIAFALFAALGRAVLVEPHRRLEQQKKSLSELAAVAKRANDAFLVTDSAGRIVWTNPAFEKLSGYSGKEAQGKKPGAFLQGAETNVDTVQEIRTAIRHRRPIKTEILNYNKDGGTYWVSLGISPLRNEQGEFYGFMAISHDVTHERAQREAILSAKREIEHQALHDSLTGLPNRRALDIALQTRSQDPRADATVVRIDLDHFKYVNDTLGHAAGDFVLCEVADILREETKSEDLPARVGGDEFVILLGAGKTSEDGRVVAERMLERIQQPKHFEKKTIRVGASFGVASTLDGLVPMGQLVVGADAALYEAKDSGRNTVCLYTPQLHHTVQGRRSLALEIRRAIVNEEFVPFYQPQFDAQTHEIVGVETLVRWRSPELGLMAPNAFLPIAEQLSAVDEIDALIFRKATREISELREQGIIIPKLSFNVTAQRVQNPDMFLDLPKSSETGYQIAFEVLESVLVEEQSDLFNFSIDRLRDMGISIEIDDFGSGHASIVGLMHLRPDVMKIDQQLVLPLTKSDTIRGLLKQIVGMADLMGLKVTAEGVETMEHARILTELGCNTLQGFAFAKPQSVEDLQVFAQNWQPEQSTLLRSSGG